MVASTRHRFRWPLRGVCLFGVAVLVATTVRAQTLTENRSPGVVAADYRAERNGERLDIVAELQLRPESGSQSPLPLELGTLTLHSAEWNGTPAVIKRDEQQESLVKVDVPSAPKSTLRLRLSATVHRVGKDGLVVLPIVANAPATLKVTVPAGQLLEVNGLRPRRPTPATLSAVYEVPVGNRGRALLRFTGGDSVRTTDAATFATSRIELVASRTAARWRSETTLRVLGKQLRKQNIRVPGRLKIVDVQAAGLQSWSLAEADDDGESTISLMFRHPFSGTRTVRITGRMAIGGKEPWSVPNLKFVAADAHTGRIVVRSPGSLGLQVGEFDGVNERVLAKQSGNVVPASAKKDNTENTTRMLGFDFWRQDFELALAVARKHSSIGANAMTTITVGRKRGDLSFRANIRATSLPRQLRIAIPAGWTDIRVRANGDPARWRTQPLEAGTQRIVVALPVGAATSRSQSLSLEILASRQLEGDEDGGPMELPLPAIRLIDATVMTGRIVVCGDDSLKLSVSGVKNMQAVAPARAAERLAYGYTSRADAEMELQGTLKIQPDARKPTADILAVMKIVGDRLESEHCIHLRPGDAELRVVAVKVETQLPAQATFRWHNDATRLTAVRGNSGEKRWLVTFHPPLRKPGVLCVAVSTVGTSESIQPPRIRLADVDVGDEYVALVSRDSQRLTIGATNLEKSYHLRRIAVRELPAWARDGIEKTSRNLRLSGVYRLPKTGYDVRIHAPRRTVRGVAATLDRLTLYSRLSPAGVLRTTATLRVAGRLSGRLRIGLPDGAELKSCTVNGRQVALSRIEPGSVLLPPLPRNRSQHRIELSYDKRNDRPSGLGSLDFNVPVCDLVSRNGYAKALPAIESNWTLRVPRGVKIVNSAGAYEPLETLDSVSWMRSGFSAGGDSGRLFHFRYIAGGDSAPMLSVTCAESGGGLRLRLAVLLAVVLLMWRLRKTELRYRACGAVIAGVGAAILTLWAPSAWGPCLDGLFLGAILGAATWGLPAVESVFRATLKRLRTIQLSHWRHWQSLASVVAATTCVHLSATTLRASAPRATVSSASYDIRVNSATDSVAVVKANYRIHNPAESIAEVAIPLGRVPLRSAIIAGKDVTTHWQADVRSKSVHRAQERRRTSHLRVSVPTAGWSTLELKFSLPIRRSDSGAMFQLPTRPAAIGRAALHLPDARTHATIDGLTAPWRRIADNSAARLEFDVARSHGVTVALTDKPLPSSERPTIDVRSATDIEINDHGVMQRDKFVIIVRRGVMRDWTFALPAGRKLLAIEGANVAGWEHGRENDGGRTVRVLFRRKVASATALSFQTYRAVRISAEPTQLALGRVKPTAANTVDETVAFLAPFDLMLSESMISHAQRMTPARFHKVGTSARGVHIAYRLTRPESTVTLKVSRPASRIFAKAMHSAYLGMKAIELTTRMQFQIDGPPRSRFTIFLPEGFALTSLAGDNNADWSFGEERTMLNVTFPKPQTGRVAIVLRGSFVRNGASPTADISIPSPMSVARLENTIAVRAAAIYNVAPGETEGWTRIAAQTGKSKNRAQLVFRSQELEAAPLGIQLTPQSGVSQAAAVTVIEPTRDAVRYTAVLRWRGMSGETKPVAFTTPAWLSPHLKIARRKGQSVQRDPRIRGDDEPRRLFVTQFGRPGEDVVVTAVAELPWSEVKKRGVAVPAIVLETSNSPVETDDLTTAKFEPIAGSRCYVLLAQSPHVRLGKPNRKPGRSLSPSEISELSLLDASLRGRTRRSKTCYELDARQESVAWQRLDRLQPVGANTVARAELTTVVQRNGGYHTRAVYTVRNASREFLAVILPPDARRIAFRVNGRVTQSLAYELGDRNAALIPVPRSTATFSRVELSWTSRLPADLDSGSIVLPASRVVSPQEDRNLGWTVGGTRWTVKLPVDMHAVPVDDPELTNLSLVSGSAAGRVVSFEKAGGGPRLSLTVSSQETTRRNWHIVASVLWLAIGGIACAAIMRLRAA